jgi:hypothetical protein
MEKSSVRETEMRVSPNGVCRSAEADGWQIEWDREGLSAWAGGMSATSNRLITVFTWKETGRRGCNWFQVWDHLD